MVEVFFSKRGGCDRGTPMECSFCSSAFNETSHQPLFLDCNHCFCKECIDTSPECPTCRITTSRPSLRLRPNYAVLHALEPSSSIISLLEKWDMEDALNLFIAPSNLDIPAELVLADGVPWMTCNGELEGKQVQ